MSSSARELLSHSWNFLSAFARLPESLKLLLNDIMRHCYTDCSDNIEAANVVTRQLNVFLQQLVDVIHGELQANPSSDLQTSSDSWYLLRTLVEGINYHFNFRPAVIFTSADSDLQSAAAACRGIKQCVAQFIELLSTDESREENIAAFTIFLMDSEQDAEISVRFALLRAISRRVIAVKRPGQSWGATIDGASVRFDEDCGLSGVGAAVAPVLQCASAAAAVAACGDLEEFDDAKCAVCLCTVYESRSDGGVTVDAREMKCPGRHTFHLHCTRRWFVNDKRNICPFCRHDFRSLLFEDIAASLEHQVERDATGFTVQWSKPVNQRLAALKVLTLLPQETPFRISVASAIWWSCFDAAASIADTALNSGRLSSAVENKSREDILPLCAKLIEALNSARIDAVKERVFAAINDVLRNAEGRAGFVAAGGCSVLVEALKIAEEDETRGNVAGAL